MQPLKNIYTPMSGAPKVCQIGPRTC